MVLSYVRDLLERMTGARPEPDDDGDLLITYGGATFCSRVTNPDDPIVQVFGVAVADIDPTPELFEAINEINRSIGLRGPFGLAVRCWWKPKFGALMSIRPTSNMRAGTSRQRSIDSDRASSNSSVVAHGSRNSRSLSTTRVSYSGPTDMDLTYEL